MALKAQSQCRTSIEALAEIKYPKSATFIRQQNVASQQQVNNGQAEGLAPPRPAREKDITPANELLEAKDGKRLDSGAAKAAGKSDRDLAAVGAIDGPKDGTRKRASSKKRH
jgi:hypothetical protein